jgi:molybdenum cofactor biosynthesis enzyme MoaA
VKNISKALIKVSHVCNNNCIFCHSKKECIVLNLKQIKKKILKVKSLEIKCILLSGGEVTIRDDFLIY